MPSKETFSSKEIIQDIATGLRHPAETSEATYSKISVVSFFVALILLILTFIFPQFVLLFFLLVIVAIPLMVLGSILRTKHKIKNINIDDYEISTAIVSHIEEESYVVRSKHHRRSVHNFAIAFENGKTFRLPKTNYRWSKERPMTDFTLYHATHRGDAFTVVTQRQTEKIVAVYPTAFFTHKP